MKNNNNSLNYNLTQKLSEPLVNSPFYCRPLCYLVVVFLLAVASYLINKTVFAVTVAILVIYCAYTLVKHGLRISFVGLTAVFLCLGILCGMRGEKDYITARNFDGKTVNAVLVIGECNFNEVYASSYYAELKSINGNPCEGEVLLEMPYSADFEMFDIVEVSAVATDARKSVSGSQFMNVISKNRVLELEANEIISYSENSQSVFMYKIHMLRNKINDLFSEKLSGGAGAYASALLLGDTSKLSIKFRNDMSALGVSHILAVSGMHTSILAGFVMAVCDRIRVRRSLKAFLIAPVAILFMFIAGLSPSITRSVIMLIMSLLPMFFGRRGDSITSLFVSAFLICLVSPEKILSCSFLLSFASCLAIVVCIPAFDGSMYGELRTARDGKMQGLFKLLRVLLSSVAVSAVCSLITAPLLALYFGETSIVSIPANLVAVPVSTISMILLIPMLLFANVPVVGDAVAAIFTALYELMKNFADIFTSLGDTTVSLRYPFFAPIVILLAVMFLYIRLRGIKHRFALIAPFLICTVVFAASLQIYNFSVTDRAEAVYMTSKTSEGFLVVSGNDTMYIDIGIGGKALPLEGIEFSEEQYFSVSLDAFMLTHYHSGHISTVKNITLRHNVRKFYLPKPECENDTEVLENLKKIVTDSEIVIYDRGERVEFGNTSVKTGAYSLIERSTHPVMMLEIGIGSKELLWLGSSLTESELAISAELKITTAETLILGRHGPVMKEPIKLYSPIPEGIPIICSPYAPEWHYGTQPTEYLIPDSEGYAICVLK